MSLLFKKIVLLIAGEITCVLNSVLADLYYKVIQLLFKLPLRQMYMTEQSDVFIISTECFILVVASFSVSSVFISPRFL